MKLLRLALAVTFVAGVCRSGGRPALHRQTGRRRHRARRRDRPDERVGRLEHEQRLAHPGQGQGPGAHRRRRWRTSRPGPGLNGMPLLAPFANRLDETAFYANGKKYNFDLELGNVRGPIPSHRLRQRHRRRGSSSSSRPTSKSAWVTCRLDFYKNPHFMKQFPFAHTITMTYRVSDGALEVHTRLDNLSTEPMPVVIGYHPIYELPDGNRDDWTVSLDAKTHWIEIPQRLPTGETQPIENFFGADRTAIQLKKYALDRRRVHRSGSRRERPRDDEADVQRQGAATRSSGRSTRPCWRGPRRCRRAVAAAAAAAVGGRAAVAGARRTGGRRRRRPRPPVRSRSIRPRA